MAVYTAEIVVVGQGSTSNQPIVPVLNVFHYRCPSPVATPTKAALDTIFQSDVMAVLLPFLSIEYDQLKNRIRWLEDPTDAYVDFTHANSGSITGEALPLQNAVTLQLKTAKRGRNYRGSKHFCPIGESQTIGDKLTSGSVTNFGTVATAMLAVLTDSLSNQWSPVVFSRTLSTIDTLPTNVVANQITAITVNDYVGSMRRRQARRRAS